jgi:competence protein ComGC
VFSWTRGTGPLDVTNTVPVDQAIVILLIVYFTDLSKKTNEVGDSGNEAAGRLWNNVSYCHIISLLYNSISIIKSDNFVFHIVTIYSYNCIQKFETSRTFPHLVQHSNPETSTFLNSDKRLFLSYID